MIVCILANVSLADRVQRQFRRKTARGGQRTDQVEAVIGGQMDDMPNIESLLAIFGWFRLAEGIAMAMVADIFAIAFLWYVHIFTRLLRSHPTQSWFGGRRSSSSGTAC
jgi:hypothetical protein